MLSLHKFMNRPDGWGRSEGREVYGRRLLGFVEENPGTILFKVSLEGVRRLDMSFAALERRRLWNWRAGIDGPKASASSI